MKNNTLISDNELHILYWKNNENTITTKEAQNIANKIEDLIKHNDYNGLLVDNRNLSGVWNAKVDKIWIDLMKNIPEYIPKTATICDNIINKLQLNYLSKKAGNSNYIKAFTVKEKNELSNFLNINTKKFLESIETKDI